MPKIVSKADVLNSYPLMMLDYLERSSPLNEDTPVNELGHEFGITDAVKQVITSFPYSRKSQVHTALSVILFPNGRTAINTGMTFSSVTADLVESVAKVNLLRMKNSVGMQPDFSSNYIDPDAAYSQAVKDEPDVSSAADRFRNKPKPKGF